MLTNIVSLVLLSVCSFFARLSAICKKVQQTKVYPEDTSIAVSLKEHIVHIKSLGTSHETAIWLQTLIQTDGAGDWPPRAVHGMQWPEPLRPYHEIYSVMSPKLASTEHLTNDEANISRHEKFRSQMAALLRAQVDLTAVESVLHGPIPGTGFSREACNGFFACIAYCRHAFR